MVMIFKKEELSTEDDESDNVIDTYKQLYKIIKLKSVISYSIILLTAKVCIFNLSKIILFNTNIINNIQRKI